MYIPRNSKVYISVYVMNMNICIIVYVKLKMYQWQSGIEFQCNKRDSLKNLTSYCSLTCSKKPNMTNICSLIIDLFIYHVALQLVLT